MLKFFSSRNLSELQTVSIWTSRKMGTMIFKTFASRVLKFYFIKCFVIFGSLQDSRCYRAHYFNEKSHLGKRGVTLNKGEKTNYYIMRTSAGVRGHIRL